MRITTSFFQAIRFAVFGLRPTGFQGGLGGSLAVPFASTLMKNAMAVSLPHVLWRSTAATGGGRYFFTWLLRRLIRRVPYKHAGIRHVGSRDR